MAFLNDLLEQVKAIWNRWSATQRVAILLAGLLSLVSLGGVGWWAMQQKYVALADGLAPSQTAEYVSALEAKSIAYQLNFAGSAIKVPESQHSQARLAVRDLLGADAIEEEEVSGSLWADPAMNQARLLRHQEGRMARTIQQMKPVRAATVHITRPTTSPFVREQKPAKASVTVDLQPGVPFSSPDASAIVSLVAHSVENLSPENVTVLSTDGNLLSSSSGLNGEVNGQLEYRTLLESSLASKAETLLTPLLGFGNATVRVSAEIDFTQTERTQKLIDTESKGKIREESRKITYTGNNPVAMGPPGTSSNVALPTKNNDNSGRQHESEDLTTEYINGETTDLIRELPGKVLRLTVAAVVQLPDGTAAPDSSASNGLATGSTETPQASAVTQEQIVSIIKNAVGFDESRGDQIEVIAATLAAIPEVTPPVGLVPLVNEYLPMVKAVSLGIAALMAGLVAIVMIRKLQPVVVGTPDEEKLSPELIDRLNDLSRQMEDDPEVVTTVLATWLKTNGQTSQQERNAA